MELTRARPSGAAAPAGVPVSARGAGSGGWFPVIVRDHYPGAWQKNDELWTGQTAMSYAAVFACTTLIAQDVGKLRLRLVEQDDAGIWTETTSPAFSPVLRKPNRYQLINKFIECWLVSKLRFGNAYILKQRDSRGVVIALYGLDPQSVTVLVAPDGSVFYQLTQSDLAGVPQQGVAVPAREVIHDPMVPLFHPLIGVSPIYACGMVALQGLKIQDNSTNFFGNGSNPGGVLTAPGSIDQTTADRLKEFWDQNYTGANVGKVAVLGDGLKYEPMAVNAVDAQLIEQLKWTTETICAAFHVPAALVDSGGHPVPYANSEPLMQQYYSQCLQSLIVALELSLDDGLGLTSVPDHIYGTEFDIDDLLWMDTATRTKAATDAVSGGVLSPDEARHKYFGMGTVPGGSSPYMQQQMFSLQALSDRDSLKPFTTPEAPAAAAPTDDADSNLDVNALAGLLLKSLDDGDILHG